MKLLLLALLVAACLATSMTPNDDGTIQFEMAPQQDALFGIHMNGVLDPQSQQRNKINAFLKLANQYIPILETISDSDKGLTIEKNFNIQFAGVDLDVYFYFQFIIGWRVKPGASSENFYEVSYTPFYLGTTATRFNGTTFPVAGSVRALLQFAHGYMPISLTLYKEGRVCFSARIVEEPIHLQSRLMGALNECRAEIIDEIINQEPIHLNCNFTAPVNMTVFDRNFTNYISYDIIGETCIGF